MVTSGSIPKALSIHDPPLALISLLKFSVLTSAGLEFSDLGLSCDGRLEPELGFLRFDKEQQLCYYCEVLRHYSDAFRLAVAS